MAAETYLYTDTDACLYKLGKLSETTINEMIRLDNIVITAEENSMFEKINVLRRNGLLPSTIDDILYKLRKSRNSAVHTNEEIVPCIWKWHILFVLGLCRHKANSFAIATNVKI